MGSVVISLADVRANAHARTRRRASQTHSTRVVPLLRTGTAAAVPAVGERSTAMLTWDDAIERWGTALAAAGRSPRTIRLYSHTLRLLARAADAAPEQITTDDLRTFLSHPTWSPERRKSARTAVRGLFSWLAAEDLIPSDPSRRLATVSVPQAVARPAPEAVIRAALARSDERVRSMILLAAYAGLRACEIAAVTPDNWDGKGLYITGKGGKTRYVPIVRADLRGILNQAKRDQIQWLYPNGRGDHITSGHVTKLVSAALGPGWTAHTLRHRCATAMFAGTHDLLAVGAVLGHSRPETTQRYVRMPDDALIAAVKAAS